MKLDLPEGPLTTPLPTMRIGPLAGSQVAHQKIAERVDLEMEKMRMLASHLGIEDGPSAWYLLALHLAKLCVPGLQEPKPKGRPKKWGPFEHGVLVIEIERLTSGGLSQEAAAKALASRKPWNEFLEQWVRGDARTNLGPDPAAALLNAYKEGRAERFVDVVRDAYRYHAQTGTIAEWDAFVETSIGA